MLWGEKKHDPWLEMQELFIYRSVYFFFKFVYAKTTKNTDFKLVLLMLKLVQTLKYYSTISKWWLIKYSEDKYLKNH